MVVVSLFDGMAGARLALDQLGVACEYHASEIDPHAIRVGLRHYPDIRHLGRIELIRPQDLPTPVDLVIGGSTCTSLSNAQRTAESGLEHGESQLFWDYARILEWVKPKWWLLENVANMPDADKAKISAVLGVQPLQINSSVVSAQLRDRLYWTNIPPTPIEPQNYILSDILQRGYTERLKAYCLTARYGAGLNPVDYLYYNSHQIVWYYRPYVLEKADHTHIEIQGQTYKISKGRPPKTQMRQEMRDIKRYMRKLTVTECERLQAVPEGYTQAKRITKTQRYKMLGAGFTIAVIKSILKGIK